MPDKFTAVILAAGMGTRLGDLTKETPKPLIQVDGISLLQYAIAWVKHLGATKTVVIGGYMIKDLEEEISKLNTQVTLLENPDFSSSQRLMSLLKASGEIEGGFLVRDADYIYANDSAAKTKENLHGLAVFGTDDQSPDVQLDMFVKVNEKNEVLKMSKELTDYEYFFNSQFYCDEEFVESFFELSQKMIKDNGPQLHVEDTVIEYSNTIHPVRFVDVGYPTWIEIDTLEELKYAEKFVKKHSSNIPI